MAKPDENTSEHAMTNLLIWRDEGRAAFSIIDSQPKRLRIKDCVLAERRQYLGDYDFLITNSGRTIGVVFTIDERDEVLRSKLVAMSENIRVRGGEFWIFFEKIVDCDFEIAQEMFTAVYTDGEGGCVLLLPNFPRIAYVSTLLSLVGGVQAME